MPFGSLRGKVKASLFAMPVLNRNLRSTHRSAGPFKTGIAKRLALTFPRSDPNGMNVRRRAALGAQYFS